MGTYTNIYIKHNFNTSTLKELAKNISDKLEINVEYGFPLIYEDLIELFDEKYTIKNNFVILGTFVHHKDSLFYQLEDDEYLEKSIYKRFGSELLNKEQFKNAYGSCTNEMIDCIKSSKHYYTLDVNEVYYEKLNKKEQSQTYYFSIGKECLITQDFINLKWWDFCKSLTMNKSFYFNYFEEIRKKIQTINKKLTNENVYFTADSGHGVSIDEENNTWQEIENTFSKIADNRIFDIDKITNKEIEYLPIIFKNKHDVFPLLIIDGFKHNHIEDFVAKNKLNYNEWIELIGSNLLVDLSNILNSSINIQKMQQLVNKIEKDLPIVSFEEHILTKAYFLIAKVSLIANDFDKAFKFQSNFLGNENLYWCKSNFNDVLDYLALLFAKNNQFFIQKTLLNFTIIPKLFFAIYQAYLKDNKSVAYNKTIDITYANYRLQTMRKLYNINHQNNKESEKTLK